MVFEFIKNLFKTSPTDKAFRHCLEADQNLLFKVMTFHQSYKTVGVELFPDTSSFEQLEEILRTCDSDTKDITLDGVAAFIGCVIREQIGGRWSMAKNGSYQITGIGDSNFAINLDEDLRSPLESATPPSVTNLYGEIAKNR